MKTPARAILCLPLLCALFSCAHPSMPPAPVFTEPAVSAPVLPSVATARKDVQAAEDSSKKADIQISGMRRNLSVMGGALIQANEELSRLKASKASAEMEADSFQTMLKDLTSKFNEVRKDADEAWVAVSDRQLKYEKVKNDFDDLEKVAGDNKSELDTLRLQSKDKDKLLSQQKLKLDDLLKEKERAEAAEARNGVYRNWCIGLASTLFLLIVIWIVLKVAASRVPALTLPSFSIPQAPVVIQAPPPQPSPPTQTPTP